MKYGETMNFNQEKQIDKLIQTIEQKQIDIRPMWGLEKHLDRIVETLALSALLQANPIAGTKKQLVKRLREIAFPMEIKL